MFVTEPIPVEVIPPIIESYSAKAARVLAENGFDCAKTTLRIAPHFKRNGELVVKLHPKIIRAANELYVNSSEHDLTFMLVPISAKAEVFVDYLKGEPK